MADRPLASDLLDTARAALLDVLLPALPPSERYTARMVARAMEIAARELTATPLRMDLQRELARLAAVVDDPDARTEAHPGEARARADARSADPPPAVPLEAIARALADRLRAGDFAPAAAPPGASVERARLHRALTAWSTERLCVTDPARAAPPSAEP